MMRTLVVVWIVVAALWILLDVSFGLTAPWSSDRGLHTDWVVTLRMAALWATIASAVAGVALYVRRQWLRP